MVALALAGAGGAFWSRSGTAGAAPLLQRPNIVLVLTDDQSLESVSEMPYLSGRPDWVSFDNAFLNVALCCPSRSSILSGQYSHHTGVETNADGPRFRDGSTIATWLQAAGYRTGFVGRYLNAYPWDRGAYVPPGWDDWHAFSGFADYFDYAMNDNGQLTRRGAADADYSTDVIARKATKFIARADGPFFLTVATNAPHQPWTPAPRHRASLRGAPVPRVPSFNEDDVSDKPAWVRVLPLVDAGVADASRRAQYRTLLAVDDLVRDLFGALESKGVLENTVVVFMTDNGYSFGEHRYLRKICAYEECVRTPLLVRYPGRGTAHVPALAQNVDIAATFAELGGVTPDIPQDGRSLVPILRELAVAWRTEVLLRWAGYPSGAPPAGAEQDIPAFWGVRTKRYKYLELETGERELYDLRSDPYELRNVAAEPANAATVADLHGRLLALKGG